MKRIIVGIVAIGLAGFAAEARAQQAGGGQFQVMKIGKNFITSPGIAFTGAQQFPQNLRDRWLEVEVEFASTAEYTDEVTLRYFILVGDKVLTGEVTHMNVGPGRDLRSVMYVPPKVLLRFNGNRAVTPASIGNIAIQVVQAGAVKDELSLVRAPAQWYSSLPQVAGLVLNKNQTPFSVLYWDRYELIKPTK